MDHGGERPYPCPECSFTCKTKQQLNEHRRKHSVSTSYYFRRQKITTNPDANRRKLMMMSVLATNQTQTTTYETFSKYFLHHHQFTLIRVRIRRNFLSSIKVIQWPIQQSVGKRQTDVLGVVCGIFAILLQKHANVE